MSKKSLSIRYKYKKCKYDVRPQESMIYRKVHDRGICKQTGRSSLAFQNAHGMPDLENQFSYCRSVATLAEPRLSSFLQMRQAKVKSDDHQQVDWRKKRSGGIGLRCI